MGREGDGGAGADGGAVGVEGGGWVREGGGALAGEGEGIEGEKDGLAVRLVGGRGGRCGRLGAATGTARAAATAPVVERFLLPSGDSYAPATLHSRTVLINVNWLCK